MTDRIEEIKEEVKAEEKFPILAMRYVHFTDVEADIALEMIRPYVTDLAKKSGEYSFANIKQGVYSRTLVLYMGYTVKTEKDKEAIEHLGTKIQDIDPIEKDFAGYILVEPNFIVKRAHIWQAYIMTKYQGTTLLKVGMKWLERTLKERNDINTITMSSPKDGWHKMALDLGFTETFTITGYRKEI